MRTFYLPAKLLAAYLPAKLLAAYLPAKLLASYLPAILLAAVAFSAVLPAHAGNLSKLNQQLQAKTRLYLPNRLYVGEGNKLSIQGKPGALVILYASPTSTGAAAPNEMPLNVGTNLQAFSSKIGDNGVATIPLALPPELDGKALFMDAVVYTQPDFSDMTKVDILDSAGQLTANNQVMIVKPNLKGGKGASLMPGMPGMNPQMMQQLQTMSEAQSDPRKRDLLYKGDRDGTRLQDKNSFIPIPGLPTGGGATP